MANAASAEQNIHAEVLLTGLGLAAWHELAPAARWIAAAIGHAQRAAALSVTRAGTMAAMQRREDRDAADRR